MSERIDQNTTAHTMAALGMEQQKKVFIIRGGQSIPKECKTAYSQALTGGGGAKQGGGCKNQVAYETELSGTPTAVFTEIQLIGQFLELCIIILI